VSPAGLVDLITGVVIVNSGQSVPRVFLW
jgi:hypothetical protein